MGGVKGRQGRKFPLEGLVEVVEDYAACAISRIHPDEGMKPIIGYMLALLIGTIIIAAVPWISIGFLLVSLQVTTKPPLLRPVIVGAYWALCCGVDQELAPNLGARGIKLLCLDRRTDVPALAAVIGPGHHEAAVAQARDRRVVPVALGRGVVHDLVANILHKRRHRVLNPRYAGCGSRQEPA